MTSFADAAPAFVQPPLTAAEKANMKKILEAAQAHIRYRNQTEIVSKAEQMEIPLPPLPAAQVRVVVILFQNLVVQLAFVLD